MITDKSTLPREQFEAATGWALKPEGACLGDLCIPLDTTPGDTVDVTAVAAAIGMPIVRDEASGLMALGPASPTGKALVSAEAPDVTLEDVDGNAFQLSSLRGKKIVVYAWAPY